MEMEDAVFVEEMEKSGLEERRLNVLHAYKRMESVNGVMGQEKDNYRSIL